MYKFKFADIGEGVHEGVLGDWLVDVGDDIKEGDTLCTIETDKVNAEIPSPVDGKIDKLHFERGDVVEVGQVLVTINTGDEEGEVEDKKDKKDDEAGVVGALEVTDEILESEIEEKENTSNNKKVLATPVARKLSKDLGIDITEINGTGPSGRVMKEDIYQAKNQSEKKETKQSETTIKDSNERVERIKTSKLRQTIAKNMTLSHQMIPQASSMTDFDVSKLVEFRKKQKELAKDKGVNLTYMPFIIKALAIALKEYPKFNASYDDETKEIILKKFYNIGIAVDTEEGLIVPVIKDADKRSILEIGAKLEDLANKTREHTISLDELQGGTITITNYGAFDLSYGVPVIKHPEVAILGVGRIKKQPVVSEDEIVIRDMLPISLCFDHRIIDGGDAGRFLKRLQELLSNPMLLLLS